MFSDLPDERLPEFDTVLQVLVREAQKHNLIYAEHFGGVQLLPLPSRCERLGFDVPIAGPFISVGTYD